MEENTMDEKSVLIMPPTKKKPDHALKAVVSEVETVVAVAVVAAVSEDLKNRPTVKKVLQPVPIKTKENGAINHPEEDQVFN